MKPATLELIQNVLATDETIATETARMIIEKIKMSNSENRPRPGTIREAAEILGVHPVTVRRYARAGILTPIRITARNVHYDLNEVEQLAHTGRT